MIEVRIEPTGDTAEAETPEAALTAARTLLDEARILSGARGPTASFYVDGFLVRSDVRRQAL